MNARLYDEYYTPEELYRRRADDMPFDGFRDDAVSDCERAEYGESTESTEYCDYCGYPIVRGEEKLRVDSTGDIIHRKCWSDYAEDNTDSLCTPLDAYGRKERI